MLGGAAADAAVALDCGDDEVETVRVLLPSLKQLFYLCVANIC